MAASGGSVSNTCKIKTLSIKRYCHVNVCHSISRKYFTFPLHHLSDNNAVKQEQSKSSRKSTAWASSS